MFKLFRTFLLILFLVSTTTAVYSETSWITKKSDKTKVELKKEKKEKKEKKKKWIAKKKKKIKKFKEKSKNISEEVKSWISKKSKKDKYIKDIEKLPKAEVYFVARSEIGDVFFGYVNTKKTSIKISSADGKIKIKKNSQGFAYLNDGKTICKVSTEILAVIKKGRYFGEVHANCSNKTNFNGDFSQKENTGNGTLIDNNGNDIFFTFYQDLNVASKTYAKFIAALENTMFAKIQTAKSKSKIEVDPTGKYYALLIGNSNYAKHGQWANLKSPVNDITEIGNILKQKYKFKKVITIKNANREKIFKGFNDLSKLSTDNDYVLIYYSGHGDIITNQSYWIPIDAEKGSGSWSWININDIQNYIKTDSPNEILARHLVIMSDSCYFAIETKGNKLLDNKIKTYNKLLLRKARIIVASGSNEPVEDTNQDHSMFGMSFIQALKNNEDVIKMGEIVENIMFAHAGMNQQPYGGIFTGHGGGDFLFVVKKKIK